jgi:hypothetical protein
MKGRAEGDPDERSRHQNHDPVNQGIVLFAWLLFCR